MRVSPTFRPLPVLAAAIVLPVLLLTPPLTADTFFWNSTPPNSTWSHSTNWSGPTGDYPHTSTDTAYVNGATKDPIVDANYQLGYFVIQNGGHVTVGGEVYNSSLAVTSVAGSFGLTLIKHAGSTLLVYGTTNYRDFQTENLKIQDGATMSLREDATVQMDVQLILQAGGVIEGNGEIDFSQTDGILDPYNDGLIHSRLGTLRFYNSGNSVAVLDLDGPSEAGQVEAWADSTLFIDMPVETEFNGTMAIEANGEIRIAEDWTLGSTGAVDLDPGATLRVDGSLVIESGATCTGTGELRVSDGAQLEPPNGWFSGLAIRNEGAIVVGGAGSGTTFVSGFEQTATGRAEVDLCRITGEGVVERLVVSGAATLDGELSLTPVVGCEPEPGDEFTIITAASVTGTFATVTGMPDVEVIYEADAVTVRIPTICAADLDGDGFVGVTDLLALLGAWGACGGCVADIDGDGSVGVTDLLALLGAWGAC